MDQSVSTSIADLYKAAANPMRTNLENVRKSSGLQNIDEDEQSIKSNISRRSNVSPPPTSERSFVSQKSSVSKKSHHSAEEIINSYISRRSRNMERKMEEIHNFPDIQEEKRREKTVFLHELNRMKMAGSIPTRNYDENDNLADIAYECSRIKANEDQVSTVSFMKDFIKLGATGLELMNNKFNILRLNGWSGEVTGDMERYNRPLSKIYQRYWRKGSVSPFLELGFLLFGSLIVHHFKNLLMGGAMSSSSPPSPPTRVSSSAQSRNVPFNFGNNANSNSNENVQQTKRKTMRRPKRGESQTVPPPTTQETNVPPANLINQILQQQTQPFQQNGGFMSRPNGSNIGIIGVGVMPIASPNQAPHHITIDVEEKRSRRKNDPLELEILDEINDKEEEVQEHRIDIKEENSLSFDM